jgi:hypothetical protein
VGKPLTLTVPAALLDVTKTLQRARPRFLFIRQVVRNQRHADELARQLGNALPMSNDYDQHDAHPLLRHYTADLFERDCLPTSFFAPKSVELRPNAPNVAPITRGAHHGRWGVNLSNPLRRHYLDSYRKAFTNAWQYYRARPS